MTQVFLTASPGSNQTYTSPADWDNSANTIEVIAGGGSGAAIQQSITSGTGGGGGEYGKVTNFNFVTPGTTTATYRIGIGGPATVGVVGGTLQALTGTAGGDSWFNGTTQAGATIGAIAGGGGTILVNSAPGGAAGTGGVGTTHNAGGRGGNSDATGGRQVTGGGGAGGPNGAGNNGVNGPSGLNVQVTNGGSGDAGFGGAAGIASVTTPGGNGGAGTELGDGIHGVGGGGGACQQAINGLVTAGSGGLYGAGGGASRCIGAAGQGSDQAISGGGAQGIIVITYTPFTGPTQTYAAFGTPQIDGQTIVTMMGY